MITLHQNQVYCNNRLIGELNGSTLIIKRSRKKHLMRTLNAFGFNYDVIFKSTTLEKVELREGSNRYLIPLSVIKQGEVGEYPPFERQVFISLTEINKYKI